MRFLYNMEFYAHLKTCWFVAFRLPSWLLKLPTYVYTSTPTINVISDDWAQEEGWNNYFVEIQQILVESFRNLHKFHSNATKNIGNFLVRSALKTNEQPGTFKCARSRCKTCPFILNTSKISGPKRSVKITDRFTCTSANVIYCVTCTLCNKLYIGDVEKNDKDASKPVARHFNLHNHSKQHMAICGLSLHQGATESRKNLEQKFIFQIGKLNPHA